MPNNISLAEAIAMTTRYRNQRNSILKQEYQDENLLLTCETFDRAAFDNLLGLEDCAKIRIYFGMTEDLQVRAIVVAANSSNEDILPQSPDQPTDEIVEDGLPCPTYCPPPSPLNED